MGVLSFLMVYMMIFLCGLTIMRYGLHHLAHERLQHQLFQITTTPFKGMLAGIIITAVLQSSSAVTVMVITLCAAGYLTFDKALGIILGTNIGTTVTLEVISVNFDAIVLPLFIGSTILMVVSQRKWFNLASILFGFSCLFIAMDGFSSLSSELNATRFVQDVLTASSDSPLNGILFGTVLTALIQSSTAVTGMVMGLMEQSSFPLTTGIGIMLGSNVGTCITAYLASLKANTHAKQTAYAHIWLNIFGVVIFIPLLPLLTEFAQQLADTSALQLAHASVIFNVSVSLLFLPFIKPFARFIKRIHQ